MTSPKASLVAAAARLGFHYITVDTWQCRAFETVKLRRSNQRTRQDVSREAKADSNDLHVVARSAIVRLVWLRLGAWHLSPFFILVSSLE